MRLLGYLWSLPNTIIGLVIALASGAWGWRWSDGCLEAVSAMIPGHPLAQTHGWIILYSSEKMRGEAQIRVHERVHVSQAFVGGLFYLLAYGLHFCWLFAFPPKEPAGAPRFARAYGGIVFERQAYAVQEAFVKGQRPGAWGSKQQ